LLDAIGLAAYSVVGAAKAVSMDVPPQSMIVMGVLTASFGGVVRDVLAHEPSSLLGRELYITAALLGASTYTALIWIGINPVPAGTVAMAAAFGLRGGAILLGWSIPGFRGRIPPDGAM
jgi:uncharacterized membrane protein YeiH